jgi:hypothetical protein
MPPTAAFPARRKGPFQILLPAAILTPLLVHLFAGAHGTLVAVLPLFLPAMYLAWIYLNTGYRIDDQYLHYRSGIMKGSIPVGEIRRIEQGKTMWAGKKPALAPGGLIIYYRRFDKIYMAPVHPDAFVEALLARNPAIDVR